MLQKPVKNKKILYLVLIITLMIVCSCSNSRYSAYSGGSSRNAHKCTAKTYSTHSLYINKRWL